MSITSLPNSEHITPDVLHELFPNDAHEFANLSDPKVPQYNDENFISLENSQQLPFERVSDEYFYELLGKHHLYEDFDDINVEEHIQERKDQFDNLPENEQQTILKAILQYSLDNSDNLLSAMRLTGRETDRNFANDLEKKFGVSTDKVRVATEIFRSTYTIWETNNIVKAIDYQGSAPTTQQLFAIKQNLIYLNESASFLEHYQVFATHVTSIENGESINNIDVLLKSDTGEKPHFEGDGVYAGILGSYQDWNSGEMFEFNVPFIDTLPMLVSYNYPKSMVNILCEGLDIKDSENQITRATGLQQWKQLEFKNDVIEQWKVDFLEEFLEAPLEVKVDTQGIQTAIADTKIEPIYWAMFCRSLRIPRFIPQSELNKSDFN